MARFTWWTGLMSGMLLPSPSFGWFVPGGEVGVLSVNTTRAVPSLAQVIDQRKFNALHTVPPPSEAHGFTVGAFLSPFHHVIDMEY
jgi:gluconolactonase